ncbi:iron-siderophore ABC transporter substrate-binding protein [Methylobacterium sp. Leaf456]|uniref:ABC transporter substrate-binding protein n=1 Tax=Methylobacterium sp. Leaf456 TaxID=1736382 RepID=UPI0009ECC1BB|nr:iron-siderophore ABC transporter substrate-binding protein [Methylobacterium sp. Leaf456]
MTLLSIRRRDFLVGGLAAAGLAAAPARASDLIFRRSAVLPEPAQRVVALEFLLAEMLAAVGCPPVGMSDPKLYPGWIGVLSERLKGVADVGTRQQPSLEAIARLKPDLILGVSYRHAPLFDVFESIAPTVLLDFKPVPPATRLDSAFTLQTMIGGLTGHRADAEHAEAEVSAGIAHDAARLAEAGRSGRRLVVLQELGGQDTYWVFTADSLSAGLAARLGLRFWPPDRSREGVRPLTSEDLLALDDCDVMLVSTTGPDIPLTAKTRSAAWQRVPALRAGRVGLIERNIWNFGGPGSALRLSNRITDTLLKAPAAG